MLAFIVIKVAEIVCEQIIDAGYTTKGYYSMLSEYEKEVQNG